MKKLNSLKDCLTNMNSIKITIPKGFKTTDIKEYSIGEEHTVEIGLIDEKDMCKVPQPHDADSCGKCNPPKRSEEWYLKSRE